MTFCEKVFDWSVMSGERPVEFIICIRASLGRLNQLLPPSVELATHVLQVLFPFRSRRLIKPRPGLQVVALVPRSSARSFQRLEPEQLLDAVAGGLLTKNAEPFCVEDGAQHTSCMQSKEGRTQHRHQIDPQVPCHHCKAALSRMATAKKAITLCLQELLRLMGCILGGLL